MISRVGLAVLQELTDREQATIDVLSRATGIAPRSIHDAADDLHNRGLVTAKQLRQNERLVERTNHPINQSFQALLERYGHVDWSAILFPTFVQVTWYYDEPRPARRVANRLCIPREDVRRILEKLEEIGVLATTDRGAVVADDAAVVLEFVNALVVHRQRYQTRVTAPSATIEWLSPKRTLIRANTAEGTDAIRRRDDWQRTGLSKFRDYGVQILIPGEPAFWYAPDRLRPAEVICHTVLSGPTTERVGYAMLLIERHDLEKEALLDVAEWYELTAGVEDMFDFLRDRSAPPSDGTLPLPSPTAYDELRSQHDIE